MSEVTSNSNTNVDRGSISDKSRRMSNSSQKISNEKSSFAKTDSSKPENSVVSKTPPTLYDNSTTSIPNFGCSDASQTVRLGDLTTKSVPMMPPSTAKNAQDIPGKFDSILNITSQILEEDEYDSNTEHNELERSNKNFNVHNPFKSMDYRHSKTSEDL